MPSPSGAERTQRLFFALWPEDDIRTRIWNATRDHVPPDAKPVAHDGIHATLLFIGSADAARRGCLERVADGISAEGFTLLLNRIDCWRKPRILLLGCADPPQGIFDLVGALTDGASACGVKTESRPYHTHITMARKLRHGPERTQPVAPVEWCVSQFALVQSVTDPAGVQYHPLRFWRLGEK